MHRLYITFGEDGGKFYYSFNRYLCNKAKYLKRSAKTLSIANGQKDQQNYLIKTEKTSGHRCLRLKNKNYAFF